MVVGDVMRVLVEAASLSLDFLLSVPVVSPPAAVWLFSISLVAIIFAFISSALASNSGPFSTAGGFIVAVLVTALGVLSMKLQGFQFASFLPLYSGTAACARFAEGAAIGLLFSGSPLRRTGLALAATIIFASCVLVVILSIPETTLTRVKIGWSGFAAVVASASLSRSMADFGGLVVVATFLVFLSVNLHIPHEAELQVLHTWAFPSGVVLAWGSMLFAKPRGEGR